jgi:hypothetical protein
MAYKPYTPTTYPNGMKNYDIFNINLPSVAGGSGVTMDAKFSNPFIILGAMNSTANAPLSYDEIVSTFFVFSPAPLVNSGILIQEDTGVTITELGAAISVPTQVMKMFQLFDRLNPGQTLTTHTHGGGGITETVDYPTSYSNFNIMHLLETSFDSFAIPPGTTFTISPNGNDINMIIAVKRGNNQPFFTLLP